jgi:hypothetical protein
MLFSFVPVVKKRVFSPVAEYWAFPPVFGFAAGVIGKLLNSSSKSKTVGLAHD